MAGKDSLQNRRRSSPCNETVVLPYMKRTDRDRRRPADQAHRTATFRNNTAKANRLAPRFAPKASVNTLPGERCVTAWVEPPKRETV